MLRLTKARGSRARPASFQASALGPDLGSVLHLERLAGFVVLECRLCRFIPSFAAQIARGIRAGAHQIRPGCYVS